MAQPNTQLAVPQSPADLTAYLRSSKNTLAAALPKHLNPDRMIRLAVTAFSTTHGLRDCSSQSILASLILASQMGLEPGVGGQGYLIPYKDRDKGKICTFVPGWKGLVGLLNNTGRASVWTNVVYEGDFFEFQLGSHPVCKHIPGDNYGDEEKMQWVYAVGQVNGSQMPIIEAWPMSRVWRHRDKFNKVGQQHYSFRNPEMYARKVVVLQVLKYMPQSIELTNALTAANADEAGRAAHVAEGGVVLDMEETLGIQEGAVGSQQRESLTNMRAKENQAPIQEAEEAKPAAGGNTAGPSAGSLISEIIAKGSAVDAGRAKILKTLVSLRLLEPAEVLEKISVGRLASILDAWEQVEEALKPEAAR